MYPEGDRSAPPSGRMPKGGYYFDTIVRQDPVDDEKLNVEDNLQEFGPISDDTNTPEFRYMTQQASLRAQDKIDEPGVERGVGGAAALRLHPAGLGRGARPGRVRAVSRCLDHRRRGDRGGERPLRLARRAGRRADTEGDGIPGAVSMISIRPERFSANLSGLTIMLQVYPENRLTGAPALRRVLPFLGRR